MAERFESLTPDSRRTLTFVVGAVVCLLITGAVEWSSRPAAIKEFGAVGQPFYEDFTDPTRATSLEVYAFDAEAVRPIEFRVDRLENGRWVIPSHHSYPADAEEQLAKTASSVIGIERGAMVTRWKADHAQYGVVNPRQESLSVGDVEGVGNRLILRGEDDSILADYIIGDKVEDDSGQYYVRHPDEEEVYLAKLEIELSTKFIDWIETDLLEVDSWKMTELTVNDYSFDEVQGGTSPEVISTFSRKTSSDPWTLAGLNEEAEEVDEDAIRETINALGDLEIVGVRQKQQGLTPELKLDRKAIKTQNDVLRLQNDLLRRGFVLAAGEGGDQENLRLFAREGEMYASTDEGLVYRLHFGSAFTGSQEELEIGFSSDEDGSAEKADAEEESDTSSEQEEGADTAASSDDDDSSDESDADDSGGSGKPGRYVFVRVEFDKKYLADEPVKPVEPEKPAELEETDAAKEQAGDTKAEVDSEDDAASNDDTDGDESSDEKEDDPLTKIREEYEDAKSKYETDLAEYERKSTEFETKVEDGQKKATEFNRRFAEWYYVIPGDSYDKLKLSRADLVKAKEPEQDDEAADNNADTGAGAAAANQEAADKFLAENKDKEGVTTTDSGLQYEVITAGEGDSPSATSTVKVKYKGTLLDDTVFDESSNEGIEFPVGGVIAGWTEALQLMKPGGKWRLFIPPNLAYGEDGQGDIGPNSLLIFEVELISFEG